MEETKKREIYDGIIRFIESPRVSPMGKHVIKFTLETKDKQFRCTCFGDTAKVFTETMSVGDEISVQGFWNDYRGEQSLNVQFYNKRGKTKDTNKKRATDTAASDLQEAKELAERMRGSGHVRGWEWANEERTEKRYQWVKPEETRGENQIRLDWICCQLGTRNVTQALQSLLKVDKLKVGGDGKLMFPTEEYKATLDALEAKASGKLEDTFDGWDTYGDDDAEDGQSMPPHHGRDNER